MAVLDWLQELLGGGQYGDPSTPAMSTQPLGQGQGFTADVLSHLQDVVSGKVAYEGVLGPGYKEDPSFGSLGRAFDIATGFSGGGLATRQPRAPSAPPSNPAIIRGSDSALDYRGINMADRPNVSQFPLDRPGFGPRAN